MPPFARDIVERVILSILVVSLACRIVASILAGETPWVSALVLVGEILLFVFVVIGRRASDTTTDWRDWLLAFAATAMSLLVTPGSVPSIPIPIAAILFLVAITLQIAVKLNLNRSFGIVPANRGVVTDGFYGIVRHPIYASYFLGHIAFLLLNPTFWNAAVYAIELVLQMARMGAEERVLTRDPIYAAYRQKVRYRLVPGVY